MTIADRIRERRDTHCIKCGAPLLKRKLYCHTCVDVTQYEHKRAYSERKKRPALYLVQS